MPWLVYAFLCTDSQSTWLANPKKIIFSPACSDMRDSTNGIDCWLMGQNCKIISLPLMLANTLKLPMKYLMGCTYMHPLISYSLLLMNCHLKAASSPFFIYILCVSVVHKNSPVQVPLVNNQYQADACELCWCFPSKRRIMTLGNDTPEGKETKMDPMCYYIMTLFTKWTEVSSHNLNKLWDRVLKC